MKEFLESIGLSVSSISPVLSRKTADFRATDKSGNHYLIEVESQANDESYWEELQSFGQVNRTDEVFRTNVASRVVRHAVKQLRETSSLNNAFKLLAIVPAPDDPGTQASEFLATLYGIMLLVPIQAEMKEEIRECYYFDFNEFFQIRDIEGALIFMKSGCQLCINSYAERVNEFRESYFYRFFEEHGGALDPEVLEANGQAYIADTDLSRSDPNKILEYLVKKYSLSSRPLNIRPIQLRGAIRIN